jgi:hypothetical protein
MSDFLRGLSPNLAEFFARRIRQQTNEMCIDPAEYTIDEDDILWVAQRVRTQRERARALMLDDAIAALMVEAGAAGDVATIAACAAALDGNLTARANITDQVAESRALADFLRSNS